MTMEQTKAVTQTGNDRTATVDPVSGAASAASDPFASTPTASDPAERDVSIASPGADGVTPAPGNGASGRPRRSLTKLVLVILVCVAPVIASYLAYYVFPPTGRTNYGELIEPQVTLGPLDSRDPLGRFKGQWVLVLVQEGACDEACARRLFFLRQTHTALGRDRDRANMVLLQAGAGAGPLPQALAEAHPFLTVVDAEAGAIDRWFAPGPEGQVAGHLFVVDPQHNLMMRYPLDPDPARTRKDLQRLMKASRIG